MASLQEAFKGATFDEGNDHPEVAPIHKGCLQPEDVRVPLALHDDGLLDYCVLDRWPWISNHATLRLGAGDCMVQETSSN